MWLAPDVLEPELLCGMSADSLAQFVIQWELIAESVIILAINMP